MVMRAIVMRIQSHASPPRGESGPRDYIPETRSPKGKRRSNWRIPRFPEVGRSGYTGNHNRGARFSNSPRQPQAQDRLVGEDRGALLLPALRNPSTNHG